MEDAELSELVKQFHALQKDSGADQITERNVVEIVNVLIKKGLVDLLYTTDAKEYMTWEELKREVVEEVHANGGRINAVDVPGLLSVHTYHVERVLPDILASDPTLHLEGGELMTDQYLEATVQAAAEVLKEHGSLSVAQFATKYQFSSSFALGLLTNAVHEGKLSAVMQDSALYTKQFVRSQRLILRSGLLAAEQPVDVDRLYLRHGLFPPLMDPLIKQLATDLPGSFHGHTYTPKVFEAFRAEQVHNVYSSNGVVAYTALQALGIGNVRQYLVNRYNAASSAGADDHADGPSPSSPTAAGAGGGGGGGGRRGGKRRGGGGGGKGGGGDASPYGAAAGVCAPMVRTDEEHPHCGHLLSACFLSDRYLMRLVGLSPLLDGEVLALDATQLFPLGVDLAKDWAALLPRLTDLYPGLAACELVEDTVLLRNDAEEKLKPLLHEELKAEAARSSKGSKKQSGEVSPEVTRGTVLRTVAEALRLPAEQYEAVLDELLERWSGMIDEVQRQVEASKKEGASAKLRQSRAALQASLAEEWIELGIVARGLQWAKAQVDEATYITLSRHALSTRGLAICRNVIRNESLDEPELHVKVVDALEQPIHPGSFKKCLAPFPEKVRESLTPLADALSDKELGRLMDALQEMSSSGTIAVSSFHAPSKKVERDAFARMREALDNTVRCSSFSGDAAANGTVFAALVSLLVSQICRVYLDIPGKAVGAVVSRLAKEADAPASALTSALEVVTASLQSNSVSAEHTAELELFRAAVLT